MFEFVCVFLCVICMFVCLSAQGRAHVSLISSVRFKVKIGEPEKSLKIVMQLSTKEVRMNHSASAVSVAGG